VSVLAFPAGQRLDGLPEAVFDPARLIAVAETGLLGTDPEPAFDNLAGLAAAVTGTGRAFITLVDDHRSFWKASTGVDAEVREQPVSESMCYLLVGTGRHLVVADAAADPRIRDHPAVAQLGIGAWAGYPITSPGGHVLGGLCVVDDKPRPWSAQQEAALAILARAVANEIEMHKLIAITQATADVAVALARSLQDSLLPPVLVSVPGLDAAAAYVPAAGGSVVVGDFFDLFHSGGVWWSAVMGDVAGHGVEAAKLTALARYTVRAEATHSRSPEVVLRKLNSALLDHDADGRFLTAAYATFRVTAAGLAGRICLAGHPPALIRRADGQVRQIGRPGTFLGVVREMELAETRFRLGPGDTLLMFTDGATEARPRKEVPGPRRMLGERKLTELLAGCSGLDATATVNRLHAAIADHTGHWASDDTALLALRVPAAPGLDGR
jgi:serine phosphatase RsbU (regulator of sigma subunit)